MNKFRKFFQPICPTNANIQETLALPAGAGKEIYHVTSRSSWIWGRDGQRLGSNCGALAEKNYTTNNCNG